MLVFACFFSTLAQAAAVTQDGTFRLRALKSQLDQTLKAKYLSDSEFRRQIKASSRSQQFIPGVTETGFQVFNFARGAYEYRVGRLVAEGNNCRLFVERGKESIYGSGSDAVFARIVKSFDEKVFASVCRWFGKPAIPAAFNLQDEKIYIFLVDIKDRFDEGYVAGYFDHRDLEGFFGNQKPLFFMDINPGEPGDPDDKSNSFYRTLAHEFQHMVNFSIQHAGGNPEQERWLDEGFSMFSEYVFSGEIGKDASRVPPAPHFERFLENPAVNLLSNARESWFHEDTLFRQYGASFLFVAYLIEKFGGATPSMQQQFVRELVRTVPKGIDGLNELLVWAGTSFYEVFVNFNLALAVDDTSLGNGLWGFNDKTAAFGKAAVLLPVRSGRHYVANGDNSFVGSENSVLANCVNLEEINGKGSIVLNLSCEAGFTPWVAEISNDAACGVRPVLLNSDGKASLTFDFSALRRAFLLPLVVDKSRNMDDRFFYSFKTTFNNFVLYPVPNPAFSGQYLIFLKSFAGAIDQTPALNITFNNMLENPEFSAVDETRTLYVAHYQLPGSGRGQAICSVGDDMLSFSFSVGRLAASDRTTLQIGDARLLLSGQNSEDDFSMLAMPDARFQSGPSGSIGGPYDLFTPETVSKTLLLPESAVGNEKTGLCRVDSAGLPVSWQRPVSIDGLLQAKVNESGRYCLFYDGQVPVLKNLRLGAPENGQSRLYVAAEDSLSGVDAESLKVFVNDIRLPALPPANLPALVSLRGLSEGRHKIAVEVSDHAGNVSRASIVAQIALPVSLKQASVYPNPCQHFARFKISFNGKPVFANAEVSIYDTSGHRVATLPLSETGAAALGADWNLLDRRGHRVSNGLYFYRARFEIDGQITRASGKLAVVR